jgi:hypothetical protein
MCQEQVEAWVGAHVESYSTHTFFARATAQLQWWWSIFRCFPASTTLVLLLQIGPGAPSVMMTMPLSSLALLLR